MPWLSKPAFAKIKQLCNHFQTLNFPETVPQSQCAVFQYTNFLIKHLVVKLFYDVVYDFWSSFQTIMNAMTKSAYPRHPGQMLF